MWELSVLLSLLRRVKDLECKFHHHALLLPATLAEKLLEPYHIPIVSGLVVSGVLLRCAPLPLDGSLGRVRGGGRRYVEAIFHAHI